MYNRKFGIELELLHPDTESVTKYIRLLKDKGIDCPFRAYDARHKVLDHWKFTTDASIPCNGKELVSPPMSGEDAFNQIKTITELLVANGCTVNAQCGFHVHFDVTDLTENQIIMIYLFYRHYEDIIDMMMPTSRRSNNLEYIKTLKRHYTDDVVSDFNISKITAKRGKNKIKNFIRGRNRYVKLNLFPYLRQGTIEFRHHSGTLNYSKIESWIKFCMEIIDASKNNRLADYSGYTFENDDLVAHFEQRLSYAKRRYYGMRPLQNLENEFVIWAVKAGPFENFDVVSINKILYKRLLDRGTDTHGSDLITYQHNLTATRIKNLCDEYMINYEATTSGKVKFRFKGPKMVKDVVGEEFLAVFTKESQDYFHKRIKDFSGWKDDYKRYFRDGKSVEEDNDLDHAREVGFIEQGELPTSDAEIMDQYSGRFNESYNQYMERTGRSNSELREIRDPSQYTLTHETLPPEYGLNFPIEPISSTSEIRRLVQSSQLSGTEIIPTTDRWYYPAGLSLSLTNPASQVINQQRTEIPPPSIDPANVRINWRVVINDEIGDESER